MTKHKRKKQSNQNPVAGTSSNDGGKTAPALEQIHWVKLVYLPPNTDATSSTSKRGILRKISKDEPLDIDKACKGDGEKRGLVGFSFLC